MDVLGWFHFCEAIPQTGQALQLPEVAIGFPVWKLGKQGLA